MLPFENQPDQTKPDFTANDLAAATPPFAQFQANAQPLADAETPVLPAADESGSAWGVAFRSVTGTVVVAGYLRRGPDLGILRHTLRQAGFGQLRQQRLWPGCAVLLTAELPGEQR